MEDLFTVEVARDRLSAELHFNVEHADQFNELDLSEKDIITFLKNNRIVYGINEETVKLLVENPTLEQFPLVIATGVDKIDGKDGDILYESDLSTEVDRSEGWDFREVMTIPSVRKGEKLATLIPPTDGENGKDVFGNVLRARPGRPYPMRAGENVVFDPSSAVFYAVDDGQLSVMGNRINVHAVYEVKDDISLKTGNIDFVGNVVIRGDVPSGFTIKALGDIKIYGLVEAATIKAEGSVYISEGIAGLKNGYVKAGESVYVGYVNQGVIVANDSIIVDNSILHSECTAMKDVICQEGNIIGGTITAGRTIKANNIGNRMNSDTLLLFDYSRKKESEKKQLEEQQATLRDNIQKMSFLIRKIEGSKDATNRITLIKLKKSHEDSQKQLKEIEERLIMIKHELSQEEESTVIVNKTIYPNVTIGFGRYKEKITNQYHSVKVKLDRNEIRIINQ